MVMSPDRGGIFDTLRTLVRRGLGGRAASGRQYISWIHEIDFVRVLYWIIDHEEMGGAINVASPNPIPNAEFMQILREAAGVRVGLPANRLMLEIGAFATRSETELILKSRRVIPTLLLESGFRFEFPDWAAAARDLCLRAREGATGYIASDLRRRQLS
jgi:NAD dependent epimerase/dehydratase family enzyme